MNNIQYKEMAESAHRFFNEHFSENGYAEKLVRFYKSVMK